MSDYESVSPQDDIDGQIDLIAMVGNQVIFMVGDEVVSCRYPNANEMIIVPLKNGKRMVITTEVAFIGEDVDLEDD